MMLVPVPDELKNLSVADFQHVVPGLQALGAWRAGGQKIAYQAVIDGRNRAIKVLAIGPAVADDDDWITEAAARAQREVAVMDKCDSPHLVKLGEIPLQRAAIKGLEVAIYTEDWIDGRDLARVLDEDGVLSPKLTVDLARSIILAVAELWSHAQVHRDIKPGNIMLSVTGLFILLDLGLVFDLSDRSLSGLGILHGTVPYFSPEQTDFGMRRSLDFRSDLFSLGTTLYAASTGSHPFWQPGLTSHQVLGRIVNHRPPSPETLRADLPLSLAQFIMRLLGKEPHQRFRTTGHALAALQAVEATI